MYFSYTVIFHILSSCTLLLVLVTIYYHRIAVLCFSYMSYILYISFAYTCHFFFGFMSANTLEADTGNNCMYPKVLSLYETVISICIYQKVSSLYETLTYVM